MNKSILVGKFGINLGIRRYGLEGWGLEKDFDHFWKWYADEITIMAYDEAGDEYEKKVELDFSMFRPLCNPKAFRPTVSFGWPVVYHVGYLVKNYPYERSLCIDAEGRNHCGSPVYISAYEMNKTIEHFCKSLI